MTTATEEPRWLNPLLMKRAATAVQVEAQLLAAGLSKGECSANDVTVAIPKPKKNETAAEKEKRIGEQNSVGGVFKKLRGLGFINSGRRVRGIREEQHGRRVDVWELTNHSLAREKLQDLVAKLVATPYIPREEKQAELF